MESDSKSIFQFFTQAETPSFEAFMRKFLPNFPCNKLNYLIEFLRNGQDNFLHNGKGIRTGIVIAGNSVIPVVVNDGDVNDCYLVSSYVHYITYLIEEVKKMKPQWLGFLIRQMLRGIGTISQFLNFNRTIFINNWLFTTSLASQPTREEIALLKAKLIELFPTHALVYRGLDLRNEVLWAGLIENGFQPLIHRPFLEWNPQDFLKGLPSKKRKQVKKDIHLTEGHPFHLRSPQELSGEETEQITNMYESLYMIKHSPYNACYTKKYFQTAVSTGINGIYLIYLNDKLVGFVTYVDNEKQIIAAVTGYDPTGDCREGSVYSAAMAALFADSLRKNKILFLSTGASAYKRGRGAYELMEYEGIFVNHLSFPKKSFWMFMKKFLEISAKSMDVSQI